MLPECLPPNRPNPLTGFDLVGIRGIKYVSELLDTGYGRAGRGYLRALRQTGVPITWTPMVVGRRWGRWLEPYEGSHVPDDEFADLVNLQIDYDVVLVHLIADYFLPWRQREPGKSIVGVIVWELDKLPLSTHETLNRMDALVVPCRWNRSVFQACGVTRPIAVVPHIGHAFPAAKPLSIRGVHSDDFVFYTIAAWRERNAPHLTLESYLSAFSGDEKVVLVLKTEKTNERAWRPGFWWHRVERHVKAPVREIAAIRRQTGSTARVVAITDHLTDSDLHGLHARGDCYVSLTRAEGWGLGAYEAALAGKPVIITGHGGQLDFLPSPPSYHVDFRTVPYRNPQDPDGERMGALWAEPDLADGARLMREVFSAPAEARRRGAELQSFVQEHFRAERITEDLLQFMSSLS